jgi:copper transport protein
VPCAGQTGTAAQPERGDATLSRLSPARRVLLLAAATAAVALLPASVPASAHALLQSSDPAANTTLQASPTAVTIRFGERPDPRLSTIKVLDTSGKSVTAGEATAVLDDPLKLTVGVQSLAPGVYTVAWRTVSAVDGHLAAGSFAFGVQTAPVVKAPPGGASGSADLSGEASPSALSILGRWLFYVGLIGLLGAAVAMATILRALTPRSAFRLAAGALVLAVGGAIVVFVAQLADAGADPGTGFGSSLGMSFLGRLLPLLVAAIGLVLAWRTSGSQRMAGLLLAAAGAGGSMLADVAASHAAAGALPLLNSAVQAIHIAAAGLWIGGLAALLLALRAEPSENRARAVRRYSLLATAGIATVTVSGLLRAAAELRSLDDLLATDFGRLLLIKSALVLGLAALGAINHFRNVPRGLNGLSGVRRIGRVELGIAALVLLSTAGLVNLAPPVQMAAASSSSSEAPLAVDAADFATTLRLHLEVTPGTAGFDTFTATVKDYDTEQPVQASDVTLRFRLPARTDVGASTLRLPPTGDGVFSAGGANLSLDGTWAVSALVDRGTASVEVPLELQTKLPPQPVDVNAVAGTPTIYTVHLASGSDVQVYLDPGTAGANDVHATFFDAAGAELPITMAAISVTPSSAAATAAPGSTPSPGALTVRMLEPGHFVGTTTLAAGSWEVRIDATAPDGQSRAAQLGVSVQP